MWTYIYRRGLWQLFLNKIDRGKAKVNDLNESVEYILADMQRLLNR